MTKGLPALIVALFAVLGCQSKDGELSKKDESTLRNNFSRSLTPEEIAHMNAAKPAAPPSKGR